MDDRQKLAAETRDYLAASINESYYLEELDDPRVLRELATRVLNARFWRHDLPDFDAVLAVVRDAALRVRSK